MYPAHFSSANDKKRGCAHYLEEVFLRLSFYNNGLNQARLWGEFGVMAPSYGDMLLRALIICTVLTMMLEKTLIS